MLFSKTVKATVMDIRDVDAIYLSTVTDRRSDNPNMVFEFSKVLFSTEKQDLLYLQAKKKTLKGLQKGATGLLTYRWGKVLKFIKE